MDEGPPGCPGFRYLDGVGHVCPRANGLFEVFTPGGESLGFTHGPDPRSIGGGPEVSAPKRDPICVESGDYYGIVIYARATDLPDRYATKAPAIRDAVRSVNGHLNEESMEFDTPADLRILCSLGEIVVKNEVLPTKAANADFASIVADLKAKGYTNRKMKHWVYYDDADACSCAGTGHIYDDDRLIADNHNNGAPGTTAMFAVSFEDLSLRVMMHEYGHTLGAVQNSAPHTSGAHHCNDGLDVMCYADGGSKSRYDPNVCKDKQHFDCNHDDYFNPDPAPGSYLARHWNLGSTLSRFVTFGEANHAPTMQLVSCTPNPSAPGQSVTCSVRAVDDSTGVYYEIDWGDGSAKTRVPATGHVAPGMTQTASHDWSSEGEFTVSVTATDDGSPARSSTAMTEVQTVEENTQAPVMETLTCTPNPSGTDVDATCTVSASDDSSGVFYEIDWGDGTAVTRVPARGYVAPGASQTATHRWTTVGTYTVSATATDNASPGLKSAPKTHTQTVKSPNTAPTMEKLSCSPNPSFVDETVTCTFRATDDSPGVFYDVDWGDGAKSRVPAAGHVAPGQDESAPHAWTKKGTYTVSVTATDDDTPPLKSPAKTLTQTVNPIPCVVERRAKLPLGLLGHDVEGVSARTETGIPPWCRGHFYRLTGGLLADFDVCWLSGATVVECHRRAGSQSGNIPAGADAARILLVAGANAEYLLATT